MSERSNLVLQTLLLAGKILLLTVLLFVCFAVGAQVSRVGEIADDASVAEVPSKVEPGSAEPDKPVGSKTARSAQMLFTLLVVCLVNTLVIAFLVLRSRWTGLRLAATVALVFYGSMTLMPQIEVAVFLGAEELVRKSLLMGAVIVAPFSALAVLVLGRMRRGETHLDAGVRLRLPLHEWIWKGAAGALTYVALYLTFGYFIAWQNPALRELYGGSEPEGFLALMQSSVMSWLLPLQTLRGALWILLALPMIRMMKGHWLEAGLAVGLSFAVLMNSQLLLPNPLMEESVRMTHLAETASSNFLFGLVIAWLFRRRHPRGPGEGKGRDDAHT